MPATPDRPFPDVEVALCDLIETLHPDLVGRTGTVGPPDDELFVQASLGGGADDGLTDESIVNVAVFAPTRSHAYAMAEVIRQAITRGPLIVGPVVIDRVTTEVKPRRLPWDNTSIRRIEATYRVSARR